MNTLFRTAQRYPAQIWLLFWGTLTSSMGNGLVWPFLAIYIREQLDVSLTTVTLLITLQSVAGFAATAIIGPVMDQFGRKRAMVLGLISSGLTIFTMSTAIALWHWVLLLPLFAMTNAVFRIGSYAMVADLIAPEKRANVYALLRMGDNVGIAVGPALGGFLIAVAYRVSYYFAAAAQVALVPFTLILINETLALSRAETADEDEPASASTPRSGAGYARLLQDRAFLTVWLLYVLVQIAATMVFVLLGVYLKESFGIPENRFGFIIGTNAAMVVLLQYALTRAVGRFQPLPVMVAGALFYAAGMAAFGLSQAFAAFLLGMVIFTTGELLLVPTGTALAANLAPPDMRARYMGFFTLSFRLSGAVGPVIGGLLSDNIAPVATWYGGMAFCLVGAAGFWMLIGRDLFDVREPETAQDLIAESPLEPLVEQCTETGK
ncbi:MAG: MFS transporter [Chloroflexi bacterium]|nr:MFS transporter [Chloroflexota bacterium]